jgi:flagellar biosynthesis protein
LTLADKHVPFFRQKAVALKYSPEDAAPKVVAKGAGTVAEKIMEKGQEADVPIYQDAKLTEELTRLDLGEQIPPELYEVVAQVLIFISDLDKLETYRREAGQRR